LHALVWPRAAETSTAAAAAAAAMELASSLVHAASYDRCRRAPYLQLNNQVERARLQISTAAAERHAITRPRALQRCDAQASILIATIS